MKSVYAEVPYSGDLKRVHDFYRVLGVETTDLGIRFSNFEFVYADESMACDGRVLLVEVDVDLDEIEAAYGKIGVPLFRSGFDVSGPFLVVVDPAGQTVHVNLSSEGLARKTRSEGRGS